MFDRKLEIISERKKIRGDFEMIGKYKYYQLAFPATGNNVQWCHRIPHFMKTYRFELLENNFSK